MLFYIAGLLIISAIAIVVYGKVRSAEAAFVDELLAKHELAPEDAESVVPGIEQSFLDRLVRPSARKISSLFSGALPAAFVQQTKTRLERAGCANKLGVAEFIGIRLLCALIGLVVGAAAGHRGGMSAGALTAFVVAFVFWLAPDLILGHLIVERQRAVRRTLPDAIDLMLVSVEAGIGFDAAMHNVALSLKGPLSDELAVVLRDMELGKSRMDALREMATRIGIIEVGGFVAAIYEADELGASITDVLRAQGEDMRLRRFQFAREAAQKLPLQLLFPLAFFIFPAVFLVVLGPALIQTIRIVVQMK